MNPMAMYKLTYVGTIREVKYIDMGVWFGWNMAMSRYACAIAFLCK